MKRIVFAIVLLTILFSIAAPALADGPVIVDWKTVYAVEHPAPKQHSTFYGKEGAFVPEKGIPMLPPPVWAKYCPQICIQQ